MHRYDLDLTCDVRANKVLHGLQIRYKPNTKLTYDS
jgi:hypothetical protein